MNLETLHTLLAALEGTSIGACEYRSGDTHIKLRFNERAEDLCPLAEPLPPTVVAVIRSPGIGRFQSAQPFDDQAMVSSGLTIEAGQVIGMLALGERLTAIHAPAAGVLGQCLVEDDAIVGYATPLFDYQPFDAP